MRSTTRRGVAVGCVALLAISLADVAADDASARPADAVSTVTLDGHGYGHGIGLSQYGALGYAINFGWSAGQILDHYYGGTVASTAPASDMTVRITGLDGAQTAIVHDKGLAVIDGYTPTAGQPPSWHSLVARQTSAGHYRVWGRTDANVCPAPTANLDDPVTGWALVIADQPTSVTFRPQADTSASADVTDLVGLCEPSTSRVRYYRGQIRAISASNGAARTVSQVPVEQYLRSVVGGEVSYGWAALGGGKGAQALQAQAIAARSYGLAENKETYAKTCDNNCQTYRGAAYRAGVGGSFVAQEFGPTDAAVAATAGVVRRYGSQTGAIAYAMFSSSSGGYTAQNTLGFTPVPDDGDAVSGNAGHTWTTSVSVDAIQAAYPGIGSFSGITVNSRDGNGEWGGRVLTMTVAGSTGTVNVSGDSFRSTFGLKSNWFQVRGATSSGPVTSPANDACSGRVADAVAGVTANAAASTFTPLSPIRLVDTRIGLGTAATPLAVGCTLTIDPHLADDATAVVVNVTAVAPSMNGYLTAYPCGADRPLASIVPVVANRIVPGTAVVPLNADGLFCLYASTTTDVVIDLSGAYETGAGQRFQPIAAERKFDSRNAGNVRGGTVVRVPIAGTGSIPASATGVAVTVHTANAVANGYVTMWPCDPVRPTVSVLNATTGDASTNHLQIGLDAGGAVCLYAQTSMDLVVDVSGWFGPTATSTFHALMPARLLDTRDGVGLAGPFAAGQNRPISVVGTGGVPATGVTAVSAEVTSVDATRIGYITVHPCLNPVPNVSMVRNLANTTSATTVTGIVDGAGRWCLFTSVAMDALIDISGWYGA